jgi:NTP pyrophosphatase (non-canonical NTP hydrolase)
MTFEELLKFIALERERLAEHTGKYEDAEKEIFARTVKVGEEFGELCQEVLFHANLQGKHKKDKFDQNNLANEFADVIFTTLLLAQDMNVNIEQALENKIKKIEKRYENK